MPSTIAKTSRGAANSTPPTKPRLQKIERFIDSGNVYADLRVHNPESLRRKATLMMQFMKDVRRLKLLPSESASRVDLPVEKAARMRRGDFSAIAKRRMKECLEKLCN